MDSRKPKSRIEKIKKSFKGPDGKKKRADFYKKVAQEKKGRKEAELNELKRRIETVDPASLKRFEDYPISDLTIRGLTASDYTEPTEIQRDAVRLALQGKDVVGAAKTGSGKTLAFLIPLLENLYRQRWDRASGLGALVVTPTRELALQIFQVLQRVGRFHRFSAGCLIGGLPLKMEAERIVGINIVICTPGRLLEHMQGVSNIDTSNLQILVLDETDSMIEDGFMEDLTSILEQLPPDRQTLLYSATQTMKLKELTKIGLRDPWIASAHVLDPNCTPSQLTQHYMVCNLEDKVNVLYSFLANHPKTKILVFMNCCKQVRYLSQIMHKLLPNRTLLAVHSRMVQSKRVDAYMLFNRKQYAILFATDVAARGLDFPSVQWVVQLDCPETAKAYIHRVGRTARHKRGGEGLLLLAPSETGFLSLLKDIPITHIKAKKDSVRDVRGQLTTFLTADEKLEENAKQAFAAYLQRYSLLSDKAIFDVARLDRTAFAQSLGLEVEPEVVLRPAQEMRKEREAARNQELASSALEKLLAHSQKVRKRSGRESPASDDFEIPTLGREEEEEEEEEKMNGAEDREEVEEDEGEVEEDEEEEDEEEGDEEEEEEDEEEDEEEEEESSDASETEFLSQRMQQRTGKDTKGANSTDDEEDDDDEEGEDEDEDEDSSSVESGGLQASVNGHGDAVQATSHTKEADLWKDPKWSRQEVFYVDNNLSTSRGKGNGSHLEDDDMKPQKTVTELQLTDDGDLGGTEYTAQPKAAKDTKPSSVQSVQSILQAMAEEDKKNKESYDKLVKAKHQKEKQRKREENLKKKKKLVEDSEDEVVVTLGGEGDDMEPEDERGSEESEEDMDDEDDTDEDGDEDEDDNMDEDDDEDEDEDEDYSEDEDEDSDEPSAKRRRFQQMTGDLEDLALRLLEGGR